MSSVIASTISFPPSLPNPISQGYTFQNEDNFVRAPIEKRDPEINQLVNNNAVEVYQLTWWFTRDQMETFKKFYDQTLIYGARSFNIELFSEEGLVSYVAKFRGPYTATAGWFWQVKARLFIERYQVIV